LRLNMVVILPLTHFSPSIRKFSSFSNSFGRQTSCSIGNQTFPLSGWRSKGSNICLLQGSIKSSNRAVDYWLSQSFGWNQARFYAKAAEKGGKGGGGEKDDKKKAAAPKKKKVLDEKQQKKKQEKQEAIQRVLEEKKEVVSIQTVGAAPKSTAELFSQTIKELQEQKVEARKEKEKKSLFNVKSKVLRGWRKRGPKEATAIGKTLKTSVKKLNLLADLIRGFTYKNAVIQLKLSKKRVCKKILKVVDSCRFNAENIHGLDPERLIISEIWTGRGTHIRGLRTHSKGRGALMKRPRTNLHVVMKEVPAGDSKLLTKAQQREHKYLERLNKMANRLVKPSTPSSSITQDAVNQVN